MQGTSLQQTLCPSSNAHVCVVAGNFFFAGSRTFFGSLEAAVFQFSRVARIPEGSLVLPAIRTEVIEGVLNSDSQLLSAATQREVNEGV